MKKLFNAIRSSDLEGVKKLISSDASLVNCVAKKPPKKDDGQSPLQVALKTGNFDIARYLIANGADLNFMEGEPCANAWRTPVIHDAINAAVMCSRWNINDKPRGLVLFSNKERADEAYEVLSIMLANGADVNKLDTYGNSSLWRYCLQANQVLPNFNYVEQVEGDDRIFTDELHEDLKRILTALKDAGADISYASPNFMANPKDFYVAGSLSVLLNEVFG